MSEQFAGTVDIVDGGGSTTIKLSGNSGNLTLGGGGHDGDLLMKNNAGATTIGINGQSGAVHLGGTGEDGDLLLRASNNQNTIHLNGATGNAHLGGGGQDGDLTVKNNAGTTTIRLDGQAGEIRIRDWRISVPDYVFDENYELRDAAQLRAYVAENKHLPGVPSATEIAEHGIDLTRFCVSLLEKIEELTLYSLRQDERLGGLERRLRALEGKAAVAAEEASHGTRHP